MAVPAQANPHTAPPALCLVFSLSISKVSSIMDFELLSGITLSSGTPLCVSWFHAPLWGKAALSSSACKEGVKHLRGWTATGWGGRWSESPAPSRRRGRNRSPGPEWAVGQEQNPNGWRGRSGAPGAGPGQASGEQPWRGLREELRDLPRAGKWGGNPQELLRKQWFQPKLVERNFGKSECLNVP